MFFFSDYTYHSHHTQQDHFYQHDDRRYSGTHYIPTKPHKPDPFEPYLPLNYHHQKDKDYWGLDHHSYGTFGDHYGTGKNNYYLPPKSDASNHWGLYGNSIGSGYRQYGTFGHKESYGYWSHDKYEYKNNWKPSTYIPLKRPEGDKYLPLIPPDPPVSHNYFPVIAKPQYDNAILPSEPRKPISFGFLRDGMDKT